MIRCLVVDDEPLALHILEDYISKMPFLQLLKATTNPIEALQLVQEGNIDLIFLDIQMPKMGGIDVLRRIAGNRCRVILLTAHADEMYRKKCLELNVLGFYDKITEFHDFIEFVKLM